MNKSPPNPCTGFAASPGRPLPHESAHLHPGEAAYTDDIPELAGTCTRAGLSPVAMALGIDGRLLALPGVVDVLTAKTFRATTTAARSSRTTHPADGGLRYLGQPVFAVVAPPSRDAARAEPRGEGAVIQVPTRCRS